MELCASLQKIGSITFSILLLHTVTIEGGVSFLSVDERCIPTCTSLNNIPNWTFLLCDGDRSTCAWQCAAQRMGCDEGLIYHCAQDFQNYELKRNKIEYIEACAPERSCNAGEEPYVTFSLDDVVRSPRNAKINCVPCADPNFYNSQAGKSSASYSRCYQQKFNKCIPEDHKINCGDISWRDRKETDGYCRCDARNGYAPENENVKTRCFYSVEYCAHKTCPHPAQELLLNYTCGDRCPSGMHRTEISDECVPNKLDQTTKYTPTILVFQRNGGKSTSTETIEVISTKRVDVKGNSDELYKDILLPLSIIVGVVAVLSSLSAVMFKHRNGKKYYTQQTLRQLKKAANIVYGIGKSIMAGDPVQVTGDKPTIKTDLRSRQMEQHSYPVGSSQGIEITSCAQDATEEIPQEIEETSFSISRDQTFPSKDREIKDQSDSEKSLLLGHEKSPPLEKFANTTTVIIESRDKNGDMNTASGQTSRSIAEPDESCELCNCDSPGNETELQTPISEEIIAAKKL
ncbi:uncharacterized protein LOC128213531 isoform X1 [Mya arenaria]|nr:uncharacterized protein LOC128213531 isoform X1 [Mya arenaria]XP_052775279.1 uncharacterized protein LOC128213531 isoform X1 [Mya arenaria]XP_052775280.1 uncharacterized protein LOC128213531 isoform X1 [Mya arenaria]